MPTGIALHVVRDASLSHVQAYVVDIDDKYYNLQLSSICSQEILLNRIPQLEEKRDAVHEQKTVLRWTIETQIVPSVSIISELLVVI
jgi:hypothetical protein